MSALSRATSVPLPIAIPTVASLSDRTVRNMIFENFYGTLIVDTIGIGLAAAGLLNPLLAAFIHVASELAFILNSTRLLPRRETKTSSHQQVLAQA